MLSRSPLVMVLSQIRFPMEVLGLKPANSDAVDGAMSAVDFPMARGDAGFTLDAGANGTIQVPGNPESRVYFTSDFAFATTVNPRFISLYCVDRGEGIPYAGHEAFIEKLCDVVRGISSVIGQMAVERVGYRYVDSLRLEDAQPVLRDPFRGALSVVEGCDLGLAVSSTTVEAFLSRDGGAADLDSETPTEGIHVVSGTVPTRTVIDPAIPPTSESRWIVDIDAYSSSATTFSEVAIRDKAYSLADAGRGLFYKHIVNESFTARFE